MSHNIDLSKFNLRTDLAIELTDTKPNMNQNNINITEINLDEIDAKKINKDPGFYITIEYPDITDYDSRQKVKTIFVKELKKILKKENIKQNNSCLIIGLGNEKSTPDSLGPKTIDKVLVTRHLFKVSNVLNKYRQVSIFKPGVMGQTGIDTTDMIKNSAKTVKPHFIIIIDSLVSNSVNRLNKTIQITNTGITPGSGINKNDNQINKKALNIPVIAVGVPTSLNIENKKTSLIVTPAEEDFVIEKLSDLLSEGLNEVLHK